MRTNRNNHIAIAAAFVIGTMTAVPVAAAEPAPRTASATAVSRRIVVSIPDRKLALIEDDEVVTIFEVAVGKPATPSPVGTFTIVNRVSQPTYYKPGTVIPPGSANPIGTRWIGLNEKGYGIHGTDKPASIGFAKSHGCIRLRNHDVERLFERVRPGDVVELHGERTVETARLFGEAR